jgi:hypothetical protein
MPRWLTRNILHGHGSRRRSTSHKEVLRVRQMESAPIEHAVRERLEEVARSARSGGPRSNCRRHSRSE